MLQDVSQAFVERVWNQRDLNALSEIVSPDVINHDPTGDVVGIDGVKAFVEQMLAAFPDVQGKVSAMTVDGDVVRYNVDFTGTHRGELMGVPPSGKTIRVHVKVTDHIVNGKIAESWAEWDPQDMMRQIGAG